LGKGRGRSSETSFPYGRGREEKIVKETGFLVQRRKVSGTNVCAKWQKAIHCSVFQWKVEELGGGYRRHPIPFTPLLKIEKRGKYGKKSPASLDIQRKS